MKTLSCSHKVKKCNDCTMNDGDLEHVAKVIKTGGLAVYPTDTLYGIAADPFNDSAVKKVFISKNRPFDMPLSIAVSDVRMLESVAVLNDPARRLIQKFLPGPLTILLTKKPSISDLITSGDNQVGIRIPDHPFALKLIKKIGPITATSANLHSSPDPTSIDFAKKELGTSIDLYIDCGKTRYSAPSTIIDLSEGEVDIVRTGVISKEDISNALSGR